MAISNFYNNNLYIISKILQLELCLEYKNISYNTNIFAGSGLGKLIELLALEFNKGYVNSGSGGSGFDLINFKTKKIVEVKSCCTIQASTCQECKIKFSPLFSDKCPNCKSNKIKNTNDSRFGINAEEFLREYNKGYFDNFTLCHLYLKNYDKTNNIIKIQLDWFKIDFSNKKIKNIQLQYFINQKEKGRKANCNLLPNQYDFYKLCPLKICETLISIPINDYKKNVKCETKEVNYVPRISKKILYEKEYNKFENLKTYDNKTETADSIDFTLNIDYRKKNLGKERGNTRIGIDNIILN